MTRKTLALALATLPLVAAFAVTLTAPLAEAQVPCRETRIDASVDTSITYCVDPAPYLEVFACSEFAPSPLTPVNRIVGCQHVVLP